MLKLKSLAVIALTAFTISACSNSNKDVENISVQDLYTKGQTYLQNADYSQAIRYLDTVEKRFPASTYSEQTQLNLIYAYYKSQDYQQALTAANRFLKQHPHSQNLDYIIYMVGLTNFILGDNWLQDLFKVDRATRESSSIRTAFANFQVLVQNFPNSPYAADAIARMAYIKASLARHELAITKFYAKRDAHVAVANRVTGMLRQHPDTQATLDALPLMKEAYEKMSLPTLAQQVETLIQANKGKKFEKITKPKKPQIIAPKN
ncbi:Beta-barrel assembly machine subunit BamD [Bisgaardia hudsonensis]|uniref:Outer membrane protein assembly factor BamD n=1 Tax=Bisgaardia hudsonensis TaxID=109472 RepID=A0A4R2MZX5_9PAST|nr:outer membrane protein assembly factor BamD [Bisgaardia hudsonensis]QLB13643.1 outer membrane assembly protein BamD [Bisgaardia hudsonensis]TCP11975.1 Beta-barrel assembly machine subunit BamD [Bisgaardia hudsonensis]